MKKKLKATIGLNYWIVIPNTQDIIAGATEFGNKHNLIPYHMDMSIDTCYATLNESQLKDLKDLIPGVVVGFDYVYGPKETCRIHNEE